LGAINGEVAREKSVRHGYPSTVHLWWARLALDAEYLYAARTATNADSCLRLVRPLAAETHEEWIEVTRYLNMEFLWEHKKQEVRAA